MQEDSSPQLFVFNWFWGLKRHCNFWDSVDQQKKNNAYNMTGFHNKLSTRSDFGNCHEFLCNGCLKEGSTEILFLFCGELVFGFFYIKKRVWWLRVSKKGSINGFIECFMTNRWFWRKVTLGVALFKGAWDWANCAYMSVSVALYIAFWDILISERIACSCLLWSCLSSLICKWKGLSFCCSSSIKI